MRISDRAFIMQARVAAVGSRGGPVRHGPGLGGCHYGGMHVALSELPHPDRRVMQARSDGAWLARAVHEQMEWMDKCGGDLAGYIANYGDPGQRRCYGSGGTAIYMADAAYLAELASKTLLRGVAA